MPELVQTITAMNEKEHNQRKFAASLKGIQLDDGVEEKEKEKGSTFEDIQRRALGIKASADDVVGLQGPFAAQAGFGIGAGLGYSRSN
jgi:hypothetical protein